ncbi:MAG: hypothetical protein ACFFFB_06945 [Candidatus Heimdallarchaeota archaeon]
MMITKSKLVNNFVGPRAIYDPNYVPPKILHRKKEESNLYSILKDSFSDNFCLNVLYQGVQGIGKKVIVNKVVQDLVELEVGLIKIHKISIDCKEKSIKEILFSLITEISKLSNIKFNFTNLLNCNLAGLWNSFKFINNKANSNLILLFSNIENLKPKYYKKILQYSKESKINLISTVNKVLTPSTLDLLEQFDLKKKLSYYNFKELFDIIQQRVNLTFISEIDKELIEFITDLIFEHYVPVPGKGIDILRELYPILSNRYAVNNSEIIEILHNQFDSIHISDDFALLNYVSEEDIITLLFIDNLSNHFLKNSNYYITFSELRELYFISCESIGYNKSSNDFFELMKALHSMGILNYSKKNDQAFEHSMPDCFLNYNLYFIALNPKHLKNIVDAIFNKF